MNFTTLLSDKSTECTTRRRVLLTITFFLLTAMTSKESVTSAAPISRSKNICHAECAAQYYNLCIQFAKNVMEQFTMCTRNENKCRKLCKKLAESPRVVSELKSSLKEIWSGDKSTGSAVAKMSSRINKLRRLDLRSGTGSLSPSQS